MRLVILGGPGAGKSTQSSRVGKALNLPVISMGGVLRQAISSETPLGLKARPYVEQGELLPDSVMIEFVKQRLTQKDVEQGWILEGYPRTAFQAEELDFLLEDLGQPLDWTIYLEIDQSVMIERSLARSLFDDHPEAVSTRIEKFAQFTTPLLEYYTGKNKLLTVDGCPVVDEVTTLILAKV